MGSRGEELEPATTTEARGHSGKEFKQLYPQAESELRGRRELERLAAARVQGRFDRGAKRLCRRARGLSPFTWAECYTLQRRQTVTYSM